MVAGFPKQPFKLVNQPTENDLNKRESKLQSKLSEFGKDMPMELQSLIQDKPEPMKILRPLNKRLQSERAPSDQLHKEAPQRLER
jgi:hypothetical protein